MTAPHQLMTYCLLNCDMLVHVMRAGEPASPSPTAVRTPMSQEELDVHREVELDRQLTGTARRCFGLD